MNILYTIEDLKYYFTPGCHVKQYSERGLGKVLNNYISFLLDNKSVEGSKNMLLHLYKLQINVMCGRWVTAYRIPHYFRRF